MYYYHVSTIGGTSDTDPFRPSIPTGTPFVGTSFNDNSYLVATNQLISGYSDLTDAGLQNICNQYGVLYSDVQKWYIE